MTTTVPSGAIKRRPPRRTVPKGENRTARDIAISFAATAEEKEMAKVAAQAMGFKTPSSFFSWLWSNIIEMTRNPMHFAAFEAEAVGRLARTAGLEQKGEWPGLLNDALMKGIEARLEEATKQTFGVPTENGEPGSPPGAKPGGGHD